MQNTMRAHSAGQISIEGGVDVNKGHMVYKAVSELTVFGYGYGYWLQRQCWSIGTNSDLAIAYSQSRHFGQGLILFFMKQNGGKIFLMLSDKSNKVFLDKEKAIMLGRRWMIWRGLNTVEWITPDRRLRYAQAITIGNLEKNMKALNQHLKSSVSDNTF